MRFRGDAARGRVHPDYLCAEAFAGRGLPGVDVACRVPEFRLAGTVLPDRRALGDVTAKEEQPRRRAAWDRPSEAGGGAAEWGERRGRIGADFAEWRRRENSNCFVVRNQVDGQRADGSESCG